MPHEFRHLKHLGRTVMSEEEFNEIGRQNAEINNINFPIESKIVFFGENKAETSSGLVSNSNEKESKEGNIKVILALHGMGKSLILDHLTQDTKSAADFFAKTIWRQKL
jgi:hypothetical protein